MQTRHQTLVIHSDQSGSPDDASELGFQALMRDVGIEAPLRVRIDSTAAVGICTRQGLGKLRHLDTHTLWIQQAVRTGRVDLRKVPGDANPADLGTKILTGDRIRQLCGTIGLGERIWDAVASQIQLLQISNLQKEKPRKDYYCAFEIETIIQSTSPKSKSFKSNIA